jgi:hypothetical protein
MEGVSCIHCITPNIYRSIALRSRHLLHERIFRCVIRTGTYASKIFQKWICSNEASEDLGHFLENNRIFAALKKSKGGP